MIPVERNPPPSRRRTPKRLRAKSPPLTEEQILAWADAFHQRTGRWPTAYAGFISETLKETWNAVDTALAQGLRGLPGGSSLAQLLASRRSKRNRKSLPPLTTEQLLQWADDHHRRTGEWPTTKSGVVAGTAGETWCSVNKALQRGRRGLSGGSSLARLLASQRGIRNQRDLPRLTVSQILAWADDHHARTDHWPTLTSGAVFNEEGETWARINAELTQGLRGLPAGSSLARLLAKHRGVRSRKALPRLRIEQILAWADAFRARTGRWPTQNSGPVEGAPGETWTGIELSLRVGRRGLAGGSSLFRLLAEHRGARSYPRPKKISAVPPNG